jgi:hypothetical protein
MQPGCPTPQAFSFGGNSLSNQNCQPPSAGPGQNIRNKDLRGSKICPYPKTHREDPPSALPPESRSALCGRFMENNKDRQGQRQGKGPSSQIEERAFIVLILSRSCYHVTSWTLRMSGNLSLMAAWTPMPIGGGPSNFTVQTPASTDSTCAQMGLHSL